MKHIPVRGQEEQRDNTTKTEKQRSSTVENGDHSLKVQLCTYQAQVPHPPSWINKLLKTQQSLSRDNFKQNSQESIYTDNIATETKQHMGQLCSTLLSDREHWLEMG